MKLTPIAAGLPLAFLIFTASLFAQQVQTPNDGFTGTWIMDRDQTRIDRDAMRTLKDFRMQLAVDEGRLIVRYAVDGIVEVKPIGKFGNSYDYGGTLALRFSAPSTTYELTGKEIKIEPRPGDITNGTTKLKVKVSKDGRTIELTALRELKGGVNGVDETGAWDTLKLSPDGSRVTLERAVQTKLAHDGFKMVLIKKT